MLKNVYKFVSHWITNFGIKANQVKKNSKVFLKFFIQFRNF